MPDKIGLILLAAGGSTRMGQPKQLLLYKNQTLLRRAAEQALAAGCDPVIVVLGSNAPRLRTELTNLPVHIMENPDWQQGMGTSIRTGLSAMPPQPVIITLCDQPLIDAAALKKLIDAHHSTNRPLIAAQYAGTLGVPALFSPEYFPALAALPNDTGAKQLLRQHADQVLPIPMEFAATDIDTPTDYQQLPK
jgi:molybdenum cofactor cytidylyltransferase